MGRHGKNVGLVGCLADKMDGMKIGMNVRSQIFINVVGTVLLVTSGLTACALFGGGGYGEGGMWGDSAASRPVIPSHPNGEDWPDAGVAILDEQATLDYRMGGGGEGSRGRLVAVIDHRVRMKILREEGLSAATIRLPVTPGTEITDVHARSVTPKGSITTMSDSAIRRVPMEGMGERDGAAYYNLTFTIPVARVDGLIEYRYRQIYLDPLMVPTWVFGRPYPVLRTELNITADANVRYDFRYGRGTDVMDLQPLRRKEGRGGRERLIFVERDLPPYFVEPDMPHTSRVSPWVGVVLTSAQSRDQVYRMQTWDDVAERMRGLANAVGAGQRLQGSVVDRYMIVRDRLHGMTSLPGLGVSPPMPISKLWAGEMGASRDVAAVLWNALREAGVESHLALATSLMAPPSFDDFPGMYPFLRTLVAVDRSALADVIPQCGGDPLRRSVLCDGANGRYVFLDPACKECRFGELSADLNGQRALLIPQRGVAQWIDIPATSPEQNRKVVRLGLTLEVDGKLQGTFEARMDGLAAQDARHTLWKVGDKSDRKRIARRFVTGVTQEWPLEITTIANADEPEAALMFEGTLSTLATRVKYEQFRIRPRDIAPTALDEEWRSRRRYDAVLAAPAWEETRVTIRLPVGYQLEDKPPFTLVTPFAEYAAGFVKRDRDVHFSRRLVIKTQNITWQMWPEFWRFIESVRDYEQTPLQVGLREE